MLEKIILNNNILNILNFHGPPQLGIKKSFEDFGGTSMKCLHKAKLFCINCAMDAQYTVGKTCFSAR
jgi:hypothetical protein